MEKHHAIIWVNQLFRLGHVPVRKLWSCLPGRVFLMGIPRSSTTWMTWGSLKTGHFLWVLHQGKGVDCVNHLQKKTLKKLRGEYHCHYCLPERKHHLVVQ